MLFLAIVHIKMPLLIFHCRTRLSLVIIQQRTWLGGAPAFTVAGTVNEFHTDFPPCISASKFLSKDIKKSRIINLK